MMKQLTTLEAMIRYWKLDRREFFSSLGLSAVMTACGESFAGLVASRSGVVGKAYLRTRPPVVPTNAFRSIGYSRNDVEGSSSGGFRTSIELSADVADKVQVAAYTLSGQAIDVTATWRGAVVTLVSMGLFSRSL
jgi:hypothetical protein